MLTYEPSHIAVLRTDRLGDMVLTLPMFPALRSRFPRARLTLIAAPYVEPLVRSVACIDELVLVDTTKPGFRSLLRRHEIDTIFTPRPRLHEAWAAALARIPNRVGSGYRWYSPLYSVRLHEHRSDAAYHEAEYNVRMISHAFGGPTPSVERVSPRPDHQRRVSSTRPRIVIHPGSGGSAHDWPVEHFGKAAARLRDQLHAEILVTGIAQEGHLCERVLQECPDAINLCGQLDLDAMIDLLADADLLLANSTGVLHIASAVGTAVVGFYPSTPSMSPRRWGPYTQNAIVLESGPGDDMRTISVDDAVAAACRLVGA